MGYRTAGGVEEVESTGPDLDGTSNGWDRIREAGNRWIAVQI